MHTPQQCRCLESLHDSLAGFSDVGMAVTFGPINRHPDDGRQEHFSGRLLGSGAHGN